MTEPKTPYEPVTPAGLLVTDLCRSAIQATYGHFGVEPKTPNEIARLAQEAITTVGRAMEQLAGQPGSEESDATGSLSHLFAGSSAGVKMAELIGPQPLSGETVPEILDQAGPLIRQLSERVPGSDPVKRQKLVDILNRASAEIREVFSDADPAQTTAAE